MKINFNLFIILITVYLLFITNTAFAELLSGYHFLSTQAQQMQDDDFQNPGYELIEQGQQIFNQSSDNDLSCSSCHALDGQQLNPASIAQYPKYSIKLQQVLTLRDQIQVCWSDKLGNFPLLYDDPKLLALETLVRNRASGEKVNVDIGGAMKPFYDAGKKLYFTRFGQMEMTCAQCHDIFSEKCCGARNSLRGIPMAFRSFAWSHKK